MKNTWISRLVEINKELLLIFSIILFAALINFFVAGQRLVLTFYNLPPLFAAYYFGRRRAVQTALGSILVVVCVNLVNPRALANGLELGSHGLIERTDMTIWAGFLLISAYAMGTLYDYKEEGLRELRQTYYGVLHILNQFVGNDKYTQNHSYRVSLYATQIAQHMGLSDDRIEDVRVASLLHDVGKLQISRDILYKAARLSDNEFQEMKTHVRRGVDLLSPVGGSLRRVLPIILSHHDKFDGTGYEPRQGDEIPLEARIISVADVYDSLVSDRPYRKGLSPYQARDIILAGAGKDFDPRVVKAFEAAFHNRRLEIPEVLV